MNKAEFKTLRESLGLSVQDLANYVDVNDRTVRRWESPDYEDYKPPIDVIEKLQKLNFTFNEMTLHSVNFTKEKEIEFKGHGNMVINLYRYKTKEQLWHDQPEFKGLPTSCHAAMLWRVKQKLENEGFQIEIVYK